MALAWYSLAIIQVSTSDDGVLHVAVNRICCIKDGAYTALSILGAALVGVVLGYHKERL
jgi:hypothetical protein